MKQWLIGLGCILMSACSLLHVHKEDVQQGNVLIPSDFSALHIGMTRAQVQEKVGSPVLDNSFSGNREIYVYALKPGYGSFQTKQISLVFEGDKLVQIKK